MKGKRAGRLGYRPALDGFRAIAVLAVFLWHTWAILVPLESRFDVPVAGFLGVDAFFVLSGFLITTLLLEEHESSGTVNLFAFHGRRALRLLPALVLAVTVAWIAAALSGPAPMSFVKEAGVTLLQVSNLFFEQLSVLTHTWALALQEQYYLVWPFLVLVALRHGVSRRRLAILSLIVALCVAAARFALFDQVHGATLRNAYHTYGRIDALLIGNALALAPEWWRWARERVVALFAVAAIVVIVVVRPLPLAAYYRGLYTTFSLCIAVLIAHVVERKTDWFDRAFSLQPLPAIGRISYGLYLFQVPILVIFAVEVRGGTEFKVAAAWAATFACAVASYFVVERPALRLKSRLVPKGREHIRQWEGAPLGEKT